MDATNLESTDQHLQRRADELTAFVETAAIGLHWAGPDGIIVWANEAEWRMLGYTRDEYIGRHITEFHADPQIIEDILARLHHGERVHQREARMKCKNGSVKTVLIDASVYREDGRFVHTQCFTRDITEEKRTEERAARLNETLAYVLEAIPDVVVVTGRDGRIEFKNPAASRFTRAVGLEDRLPAPVQTELERVLQTGEHHLPTDFKTVHQFSIDNEERFFLSRVVAMMTPDNELFGAVAMLQDVTEFRLLDEVKTNLISTVSHELKTPITSVRTALLVVLQQTFGPLNPKQIELLSAARDEGERLLRTLNALLDLTRFEDSALGIRLASVAPEELVHTAVKEVREALANARATVKTELDPALPVVTMDWHCILHVLINFLTNAIKYSPPGGEIIVRAHRAEQGVCFSVADCGPGVPAEYQSRIFDKFFRAPGTSNHGAGLGLWIAREFVHAHRGRIGVRSEPGRGSEFYFILPVA